MLESCWLTQKKIENYLGEPVKEVYEDVASMKTIVVKEDGTRHSILRSEIMNSPTHWAVNTDSAPENTYKEKYEDLKSSLEDTIETIEDTYKKELDNERRLRTEAEKRERDLQNEVSLLRRKLQGRDEPNSGQADWVKDLYNGGLAFPSQPGDTTGSAVPTRWTYTSSSGVPETDDSL